MHVYPCMCMYLCMHECMCQNKKIKSKVFYSHKTVTLMNINNISKTAICKNKARGHPFMTSQKIGFLTPLPLSTCVHMGRNPPLVDVHTRSTWNTHHSLEISSTI